MAVSSSTSTQPCFAYDGEPPALCEVLPLFDIVNQWLRDSNKEYISSSGGAIVYVTSVPREVVSIVVSVWGMSQMWISTPLPVCTSAL